MRHTIAAALLAANMSAAATPMATWDGEPPFTVVLAGDEKALCGYRPENGARFWRMFSAAFLIKTFGALKCPTEVPVTPPA